MDKYLVKEANEAFRSGLYQSALNKYELMASVIGADFFEYNIKKCREKIAEAGGNILLKNTVDNERIDGVSIIVASYKGRETIGRCLSSIANQNANKNLIEVVVVLNGELDGSELLVDEFRKENNEIHVELIIESRASVGNARNLGVERSSRKYVTFIDDDDYISESYVSELYRYAAQGVMVFSQIIDDGNGSFTSGPINEQLRRAQVGNNISYNDITSALTMNSCKLVPYEFLADVKYDENLKSGEDVVYWTDVVCNKTPSFLVVPFSSDCIYYRTLRQNSVSRRSPSYIFSVTERLNVVLKLYELKRPSLAKEQANFIDSKIRSQLGFCIRFLQECGHMYSDFVRDTKSMGLPRYVRDYVAEKTARDLIVSYCFPPYVDTAGVVTAKRIWANKRPVEVVSNQMDKIRSLDENLLRIAEDYVGKHTKINAPAAFSNWRAILDFSERVQAYYKKRLSENFKYNSIYSRAMWPGSHFAAALCKAEDLQVKWVAEFSDPLLLDIHGVERKDVLDLDWFKSGVISKALNKLDIALPDNNKLFYWCEFLPYVMADELIFTNENQLQYMIDSFPDPQLAKRVKLKSKVVPQPTLGSEFYQLGNVAHVSDFGVVNIAYFGSFYESRGLGEVLEVFSRVKSTLKRDVVFHIFTNQEEAILRLPYYDDIKDNLRVGKYLSYFDFLNLSTKMDYLFVNDASTAGVKQCNPYLPSKLSDYMGSGAKIWAACERGSSMHKLVEEGVVHKFSFIGDKTSYVNAFRDLV